MSKLNEEQIAYYKTKIVKKGVCARFIKDGGTLNILTGEITKHINVMYQIFYTCFDEDTCKEICNDLDCAVIIDN